MKACSSQQISGFLFEFGLIAEVPSVIVFPFSWPWAMGPGVFMYQQLTEPRPVWR